MKNNKKINRTFKVSLVAAALGLGNSAWGIDYTPYTGTIYRNPVRTEAELNNQNLKIIQW